MLVDYNARKNEVLASYEKVEKLVKELQGYAKQINLPDPLGQSGALLEDIRSKAEKVKEDRFNIMVAGESKSGKSTFINAYLGVELLPMNPLQCTSAIVEIKYGNKFSVQATHADGRRERITDEKAAQEFLKKNAALDDDYRDIPVPTINSEILVKSGLRARKKGAHITISKSEVQAMLDAPEVQDANIHNLPVAEYNRKIKAYIDAKKDRWQDIVTKIEVTYPFSEELKGVNIIDSPGVCARGGVSEITSDYIKNADAIIFLKPIVGQALESTQFRQFMQNSSVERNKDALFLVLTRATGVTENELRKLEQEAERQFSDSMRKSNILIVDSKAELYVKKLSKVNDIEGELRKLNREGTLDDFVVKAYNETTGLFGSGDFIEKLKEKSRFNQIYDALDVFGRKAHYILLADLLNSIERLYAKLWGDMNSRIDMFRQKAEDPKELSRKIANVKQELDIIQNKMSRGVDGVVKKFRGEDGIITREAEAAKEDFLISVGKISPDADDAFARLEKISLEKIDQFQELTKRVQEQAVALFDKELVALSNKSSIHYESLKPDFTEKTFEEIRESTEAKATETKEETEGLTFKKTHTYSVYSQNKHFTILKNNIESRVDEIKYDMIMNLEDFVENIRTKYIEELKNNADGKKKELDAIEKAKATSEQILKIVQDLSGMGDEIVVAQKEANRIKGGIKKNVQLNH